MIENTTYTPRGATNVVASTHHSCSSISKLYNPQV